MQDATKKKYIKTWYSAITGDPVLSKETIPILHVTEV